MNTDQKNQQAVNSKQRAEGSLSNQSNPRVSVAASPHSSAANSPGERDEESYVIDAGLKLLRLLECVEGCNFEPVTIKRFMQRTGFNRDLTRRLVITAKKGRWLKELVTAKERQFVPGPKLENLSRNLATSMLGGQNRLR